MKKVDESEKKLCKCANNQVKSLTVVAIVALFGAVMSFFGVATLDKKVAEIDQRVNTVAVAQQKTDIRENGVKYDGEEGKTAFELLKKSHKVESTSGQYGEFVTAIDGVKADEKSEFWALYANGKQTQVGASSYKTKNGEKIEWKLEKFKN